jgi:hypothetical protein
MVRLSTWVVLIVALAAGCQKTTPPTGENFGQFQGDVVAVWNADGRNMTLREPFVYIDPQGRTWVAPAGSVVNGASIPSAFWTAIGGPFEGKYRNASVVHDVGCEQMTQSWEDVHRMFYDACRCGGVDELKAKAIYYAVYHFGPRWQPVTQVVVEQHTTAQGQIVEQEVVVERVVRTDPPPPTPEEMAQVEAYVAEENPEPEAMREFNRDALHRRPRRGGRSPRVFDQASAAGARASEAGKNGAGEPRTWSRGPGGSRNGSGQRNWSGHARSGDGRTVAFNREGMQRQPVSQQDQEYLVSMVRQHLEEQAGEPRPANYAVERVAGEFHVLVDYLHQDATGQWVPYEGGNTTVRVSRRGQILEILSGAAATAIVAQAVDADAVPPQ